MPWTETVPVGFNWSVSIIKSDIYLLKSYICNKLGCSLKNELFKPQTSKTNLSSMPKWWQEFAGHIPEHGSLSACGYMSSAGCRRTGEKSDFSHKMWTASMGLVSAQSWVVPVPLSCLQGREIQQTWCLRKHQRSQFTPWVWPALGSLWDFTAFRAADKLEPNEGEVEEAKMLLRWKCFKNRVLGWSCLVENAIGGFARLSESCSNKSFIIFNNQTAV